MVPLIFEGLLAHTALLPAAIGATPARQLSPASITLICFAAVAAGVVLVLALNEFRARRCRPKAALAKVKPAPTLPGRNLPEGQIVYQDTDGTGKPLFATSYPLSGKPDYVILSPEGIPIPVELKLNAEAEEPQRHHVMQLAAYFVILEDLYDQAPAYGVLRYANRDFTIQYTDALKRKVARRLIEMARCDEKRPPALTQQLPSKCRVCPFQPICPIGQRQ
jgi:CRISPR-associated exonuclease Cas4